MNNTNNINTTVIIPFHRIDDNSYEFLKNAIESLKVQKDLNFHLSFVIPMELDLSVYESKLETLLKDSNIVYNWIRNGFETDYASQINYAAKLIDTKFFSILQYDDEVLPNYIANINEHIGAYDYQMFLSIIFEMDNLKRFIGFSNESVWSVNHMENFGLFDMTNTKKHNFFNYNLCGMTIERDTFLEVGGFKPSMIKYSDYEFILRLLQKGKKSYVIPKISYKHVNGLEGSIHDSQKDMSDDEKKFWYDLAKKEYFFDVDRKISYNNAN